MSTTTTLAPKKKCLPKDRNENGCRNSAIGDTRFCRIHGYMESYTDEMIADLSICSGCSKAYYLANGVKTCELCVSRAVINRSSAKEKIVICAHEGCAYKRSAENQYCNLHQLQVLMDSVAGENKRLCVNYIRGCRVQLDLAYKFSRCADCLRIDREKDHARRNGVKTVASCIVVREEVRTNSVPSVLVNKLAPFRSAMAPGVVVMPVLKTDDSNDVVPKAGDKYEESDNEAPLKGPPLSEEDKKFEEADDEAHLKGPPPLEKTLAQPIIESQETRGCTTCCKYLLLSHFVGLRSSAYTKTCQACRDDNKKQDAKRDKDHRNEIARKNDAKPERVEVKRVWREDNYEKVAETWMKSRDNKIIRGGIDAYMAENAEAAQRWRDNNPEKVLENNETRRNSIKGQYAIYAYSSELKNNAFELSRDEFEELVKQPCNYCGIIQDRGTECFNGVDRVDNAVGYILSNCVSCCKMCNYMKKTLSADVFIARAEHILTFNSIVQGNLYPEIFSEHNCSYSHYKDSALSRNIEFAITQEDFEKVVKKNCYMCGKSTSQTHTNGIDRYDNDIGYVVKNLRPCCGGCNYMKRDYSYEDIFCKFRLIYKHNLEKPKFEVNLNDIVSKCESMTKSNKKTADQAKEDARLRKQEQRAALKERYGDEEYRKMRAKEIADYRTVKKLKDVGENINEQSVESKCESIVKSADQVREDARLKKQKQRAALKEKHGEEEYKKIRAKEISDYRASKTLKGDNKVDEDDT